MKTDRKLLAAILVLIALVTWLLVLSLDRKGDTEQLKKSIIQEIQKELLVPNAPAVINGKTPILGVDYFNGPKGDKGDTVIGANGLNGNNGANGKDGESAYDIAVRHGFVGTEEQWLESLKGPKGDKGDAAADQSTQCLFGLVANKRVGDDLWQFTGIRCEAENE